MGTLTWHSIWSEKWNNTSFFSSRYSQICNWSCYNFISFRSM